jgi:hypothetical protein
MHITKNVCESLVATIINMPEKTKDGPTARNGLIKMGIRKELHGGCPDDDADDDETQADTVVGMTYGAHHGPGNMPAGVPGVPAASAREDRLRPKGRLHQQPAGDSTE